MALEMLVYSPFNRLTRLIAGEYCIELIQCIRADFIVNMLMYSQSITTRFGSCDPLSG